LSTIKQLTTFRQYQRLTAADKFARSISILYKKRRHLKEVSIFTWRKILHPRGKLAKNDNLEGKQRQSFLIT
jgi:hypothetical protein